MRTALVNAHIEYDSADQAFVPSLNVPVPDVEAARKVLRLIDAIEDLDDVQNVYTNVEIPDEIGAQLEEE